MLHGRLLQVTKKMLKQYITDKEKKLKKYLFSSISIPYNISFSASSNMYLPPLDPLALNQI